MRLTMYTDYSLRTLLYLSLTDNKQLTTIQEISDAYHISKNHLMKVTHQLGKMGYIETVQGRNGGIRLKVKPEQLNIGEIARQTEDDFHLVECFSNNNQCVITPACQLRHVLHEALVAFIQVLDQYTIADVIAQPDMYKTLLQLEDIDK